MNKRLYNRHYLTGGVDQRAGQEPDQQVDIATEPAAQWTGFWLRNRSCRELLPQVLVLMKDAIKPQSLLMCRNRAPQRTSLLRVIMRLCGLIASFISTSTCGH